MLKIQILEVNLLYILLKRKFKKEYFFSLKYCLSFSSSSLSSTSITLLFLNDGLLDAFKFIGFLIKFTYIESALEIFLDNNKSYFFNFKTNINFEQSKSDVLHHGTYREIKAEDNKNKKIVGYQQIQIFKLNYSFILNIFKIY